VNAELVETTNIEWKLPSPRVTGMICLILTESALFTIFVVAYLFYIGKSLTGPYPHEVLKLPILGSVLLFSSSGTIIMAEHMLKKNSQAGFNLWWFVTFLLGAGFLADTAVEWRKLIFEEGLTISTNLFGSTFYSLVGLHASHVVVGLILILMILIMNLTGRIRHGHHEHIMMISWYWHFVDAVWVVVLTVVYIIGGKA
jgi:cytochrome c oxidase subunit 3/cytochrome o ubiquinol oxidase subunit 3